MLLISDKNSIEYVKKLKYILIGGFICLVLVVIFDLLKVASNCDDEVEQFYNN